MRRRFFLLLGGLAATLLFASQWRVAYLASDINRSVQEALEEEPVIISKLTIRPHGQPDTDPIVEIERTRGQAPELWVAACVAAFSAMPLCTTWVHQTNDGNLFDVKVTTTCDEGEGEEECRERHQEEVTVQMAAFPAQNE